MILKEIAKSFIFSGLAAITALSHPFTTDAASDVEQCMGNAQKAIAAGTGSLGSQGRTKELYLNSFRKECERDPHSFDALSGDHPRPQRRTNAQEQDAEAPPSDRMAACLARAKESFAKEQKKMFGAGIDLKQLDSAMPGLMDQINLGVNKGAQERCARDPDNTFSTTYHKKKLDEKQITTKAGDSEQDSVPEGYKTRHNNRDEMIERRSKETWAVPQN